MTDYVYRSNCPKCGKEVATKMNQLVQDFKNKRTIYKLECKKGHKITKTFSQ